MEIIKVQQENNVNLQLDCERGIAMELDEYFSFLVPGHAFMPSFKYGQWDGKIRLFSRTDYKLPVGLYPQLKNFSKSRGYEIELQESDYGYPGDRDQVTAEELFEFVSKLNLHAGDNPIQIRDYQFAACKKAIENRREIMLSPTGSGKSLIIYTLLRWYLEATEGNILIVVPTTSLVEQMKSDFADYSSRDPSFNAMTEIHSIMAGAKKDTDKRVIVSTWQSIYKMGSKWFDQFDVVFGDECHGFKSKSLCSIMNKSRNAKYRFGTTGTLDGTQTHKLVLESLFGGVTKVTTTKKLQDLGTLAPLDISILYLQYDEKTRKEFGKKGYPQEIDWIVSSEPRNRFIKNLALDQKGNTLLLFNYVEKHGKPLYEMISGAAKEGRKVFFVSGEVAASDREEIRHLVEAQDDAIIVASLGTFSTGINIKNLHNIIFASPSKSQIRVLQSIGRGLRKSENGWDTKLYDITDALDWKSRKNFALKHATDRIKMYEKEQFKFKIYKIEIQG